MQIKKILKLISIPLILLFAFFLVAIIWEIFGLPEKEEFFEIVKGWFQTYGLWIVFVSALVEGLLLFGNYYPGGTVIFLGVVSAEGDIGKTILVVATVALAMFSAYFINYILGKYGWYKLLVKLGMEDAIEKKKASLEKQQFLAIMGSYWAPNLASITSTAAGILKVPLAKFLTYSFIGVIIWNAFWGTLVAMLGERALEIISLKWILIIVAAWVAFILIKNKIDSKRNIVS